jgi:hypothetical protein
MWYFFRHCRAALWVFARSKIFEFHGPVPGFVGLGVLFHLELSVFELVWFCTFREWRALSCVIHSACLRLQLQTGHLDGGLLRFVGLLGFFNVIP